MGGHNVLRVDYSAARAHICERYLRLYVDLSYRRTLIYQQRCREAMYSVGIPDLRCYSHVRHSDYGKQLGSSCTSRVCYALPSQLHVHLEPTNRIIGMLRSLYSFSVRNRHLLYTRIWFWKERKGSFGLIIIHVSEEEQIQYCELTESIYCMKHVP